MGMEKSMCLMVISELFNVSQDDVESYLKKINSTNFFFIFFEYYIYKESSLIIADINIYFN